MEKYLCSICNEPMTLQEKLKSKRTKVGGNLYRLRRFECVLCDHTEMIYGDGSNDDSQEKYKAIEQVNDMYKQQGNNN